MGRLGGSRYREVVARLRRFGFDFERKGAGSHEIWFNPDTGRRAVIPKHRRAIAEGTLRAIPRQAGIDVDDFLA
jgi:predicted RNA binding protein YcfA (HicA-like mRNA interferase family)